MTKNTDLFKAKLSPTDNNQNCPVRKTLEIFQGKWSAYILFELSKVERIRFGLLKKQMNGITNTMLANTLKYLEYKGLVLREQFNEIPPHVEYSLTESGKALFSVFQEMSKWGDKYL